ncbi:MAG: helix-hairpin-helix domain-containing protein, partial [Anaerolineae bacterium]|nr:helix-hairpin-helix domain-containing protein [Anaerolineae bacterium]
NIGPIVWKNPVDAIVWLAKQGVKAHIKDVSEPQDWGQLKRIVERLCSNLNTCVFADPLGDFNIYGLIIVEPASNRVLDKRVVLFKENKSIDSPVSEREDAPAGKVVEDLAAIPGIAKARVGKLADARITTFAQLASQTPERIIEILGDTRLKPEVAAAWIEEARKRANQ